MTDDIAADNNDKNTPNLDMINSFDRQDDSSFSLGDLNDKEDHSNSGMVIIEQDSEQKNKKKYDKTKDSVDFNIQVTLD